MNRKDELLKILTYFELGDYSSKEQCIDHIEEIFAKTKITAPNNKYTAPQASPKFCPRCPYQMLPSGDGYVCTKCGYCE